MALVAGYARRISGEADQRQILASTAWVGCPTPTPCSTSCTRSPRPCPPRSTSTRCSTRRWTSCGSSSTSTPSRCSSSTTPTSAGTPCAARAPARRPSSPPNDLPPPLARALRLRSLVSEQNLLAGGGPGTSPSSASGLYAVLPARGSIIGLLSIEHADAHHFTVAGRRPPGRVRGAGRARHRQRPLVQPPAHRRSRRGAHPHRPRPPRSHRPVPRVPRLRARPHRQERGDRRRQRRPRSTTCGPTSAA